MNPYLRARVVLYLQNRLRPREPVPPPVEYFQQAGMSDFLEWSLVRSWMEEWLQSLLWYCQVAMDPEVTVSQLIHGGPVVPSNLNSNRRDEVLVRLGLIWKCMK